MKKVSILFAVLFSLSTLSAQTTTKIPVLNVGTFHMGASSDANTTEYDEHDAKNVAEAHAIAKALAEFKPTVIVVEIQTKDQEWLSEYYNKYLADPKMKIKEPSELELVAFEVGRQSKTSRIYGIDYKMDYNYLIGQDLQEEGPFKTHDEYMAKAGSLFAKDYEEANTLDKLKITNQPETFDFLINVNADILMHVSTEGKSEGADEAAKNYHRNMIMYSNLNQIELTEDDRVFILMGATHTAFFHEFMKRSPKYELVNTFDYLK